MFATSVCEAPSGKRLYEIKEGIGVIAGNTV